MKKTKQPEAADISKKTALVYDHGTFVELAFRLARKGGFGKVYYCDPCWEQGFAKVDHAVIGDGFADDPETPVLRIKEPWSLIDSGDIDIMIFPDVHHAEMQEHLAKQGMPVWGSRRADLLECNKWAFKKLQDELGLKHADFDLVHSLDALRDYCKDPNNADRWIKVSPQFRGNRETFHHQDYERSRQILDAMGIEFGIIGNILKFLCEHPLQGKLEGGMDTYTVDGKHPDTVISGWEKKDKAYFAEAVSYKNLAEELREAIEPIFPLLAQKRCRQMISTEVMIEDRVLLEPTIRFPSPAGEAQMELYRNLPEIIWQGAHGHIIEPELEARYAVQAMIDHADDENHWRSIAVPQEIRRWVKLYNVCKIGDRLGLAPSFTTVGSVCGLGDTPTEALSRLQENVKALADEPVSIHVEALAALITELEEVQSKGKAFQKAELPEVSMVVEEE